MSLKKGQQLELLVSDIAYGGKGFARIDGFAVFVDQAVALDRVLVRIVKKKKNFAEARIVRMLEPSPHRVAAPCRYSGFCGGCKWQFLDYAQQLVYKRRHVVDCLEHIARIKGVAVHPVLASERIYGYRNKMEFTCSDRRWLLPEEMACQHLDTGFALGLHVPGTFHKVIDTHRCLIQPELGNGILGDIRSHMRASNAPVYGLRSHTGFWRFAMLRHSVAHDHWMVNIITAAEDRDTVEPLARSLIRRYPQVVSVVNNITARKAGVAIGEYEVPLAGEPVLRDKIGLYEFEISANSFFQTNSRGAERLYRIVKTYAALSGQETVMDLYSGTGTIAISLSDSAREVIGIEIVAAAVADAQNNCRINGIANCRFMIGDIRTSLSQLNAVPEVVIIDPPRTGMHQDVVSQLLAMAPAKIVYVSCNPATMARDLALLQDRYELLEVQPVDMFPHTFHIESVAKLVKRF